MSMSHDDARRLHDELVVFDLHADTPMLMLRLKYDLGARHERRKPRLLSYAGHVDLPRMREGGLGAQVFGLWTWPYPQRGSADSVRGQLAALDAAIAAHPEEIVWCATGEEVRRARRAGKVAAMAGIEGGHAIEGSLEILAEFAARGVRTFGLVHLSSNELGATSFRVSTRRASGLTELGRAAIAELNRLGVIVDLAHINRAGFFEALEVSRDPVYVTHTGLNGVHPHWRNIDDDQLRAVADAGGAVGVIFAPRYLGGRGVEAVVDHIEHIVNVAGEDTPALGSDFDGFVIPPEGLEDAAQLPALTAALAARGFGRGALAKILGENALRVLDAVPPRGNA